jgi:hypothetical protein
VALHQHRAGALGEAPHRLEVRLAVQRDHNVEPLRTGGLDEARQAELGQEIAHREDRRAQLRRIVVGRVEIEDAQIGLPQVRQARRPDVRRDRVLVRHPDQRARVVDERVVDGTVVLGARAFRDLDPTQPVGKSLRDVLLDEALFGYAGRVTLHRHRTARDVRQHHPRHLLVVGADVALGDSVGRK